MKLSAPMRGVYSSHVILCLILALNVVHQVTGDTDLNIPQLDNKFDPANLLADPKQDSLDDCEACKSLVKSFENGMERTMRGKHEGGDTSWEEKNLKSYTDSEVRLVEIQDELCDELNKGKAQCLSIAEDAETDIEQWWFKHRNKNVRLHDYLCIQKLKKCCPDQAFGPNCQTCPSSCNNHGNCDGSGTRKGTGECICSLGYMGDECESCDEDFYKIYTSQENDHQEFTCLACHKACQGGCDGPGSTNCTECKPGYERDPVTNNCLDINECEMDSDGLMMKKLCPDGTYCLNTDGHYKCAACHRACSTCIGYGRDKCITCAMEYFRDDNHDCISSSEDEFSRQMERRRDDSDDDTAPLSDVDRRRFVEGVFIVLIIFQGLAFVLKYIFKRLLPEFIHYKVAIFVSLMITMQVEGHVYRLMVELLGRTSSAEDQLGAQLEHTNNQQQRAEL